MSDSSCISIASAGGCFNLREAAAYTGYSVKYLYKLTSKRQIPFYKPMGGRIFFLKTDLDAFILRGRIAADYELAAEAESMLLRKKG